LISLRLYFIQLHLFWVDGYPAGVPGEWRQYPLRLPVALYEWLVAKARAEDRSLNNLLVRLLSRLKEQEEGRAEEPHEKT
jgi:hypothetical protein